jgi:hypothetical protein
MSVRQACHVLQHPPGQRRTAAEPLKLKMEQQRLSSGQGHMKHLIGGQRGGRQFHIEGTCFSHGDLEQPRGKIRNKSVHQVFQRAIGGGHGRGAFAQRDTGMKQTPEGWWSPGGSRGLTRQASRRHGCYCTASAMGCTTLLVMSAKMARIVCHFRRKYAGSYLTYLDFSWGEA